MRAPHESKRVKKLSQTNANNVVELFPKTVAPAFERAAA
jgi:hypothetical protein